MKPTLFIFIIISFISCISNKSPCTKFRTGHFILHSSHTSSEYMVDRNDSFQIETEKETGKKSKWKIDWKGDCEYNLTYIDQDKNKGDTTVAFLKTLNIRIVKAEEKYYVFSCEIPFLKEPIIDTIWKL